LVGERTGTPRGDGGLPWLEDRRRIGIVGGGTRNATIGLVGRVSGRKTRRLADECTLTPRRGAAGRPGAVAAGPARERVPTLRAARRRAVALSLLDLHAWQFSFVRRRGTPLPSGNLIPRLGCFGPRGSKRLNGKPRPPVRGVVRHERKARGLSIGALLGAGHDAACAAHIGAGEARTSAASSTSAPARWQEPLTGRMERPDQAGPGARGRVTTATPARLDFSAAEAPVKALQARCPQVARSVLTGGFAEARVLVPASMTATRKCALSSVL
jgi:hypothetical protein